MIGSHNTFSYLPVKSWWMRLLSPWHRCQCIPAFFQIMDYDVRYIDIRIRFVGDEPVFVHNNIVYRTKFGVKQFLLDLAYEVDYYNFDPIYCRIILDVRKKPKDYYHQEQLFRKFLEWFKGTYDIGSVLKLDEARIFWDWCNPIIKSKYIFEEVHTSVCSKWYQYLLGTKWFARKHNAESCTIEEYNPIRIYLIDYVNIGK